MNQPSGGVQRQGVDAAFEADETRKSQLMLEAQMLRAQQKPEADAKLVDINFLYLLHFKSNGVVRSETLQYIFYRLKQTLQ